MGLAAIYPNLSKANIGHKSRGQACNSANNESG